MPTCTRDDGSGSTPDVAGGRAPTEGVDIGACTPVHDDRKLATSKQPVRDSTKRCRTLFMGFLLYLLVVVVRDALTSPCVAACRSSLCISSFLFTAVMGPYVFTSASMKALNASTILYSLKRAAEYTMMCERSNRKS